MRIALVVHGYPPFARTGVETHAAALAAAWLRLAIEVEVFVPLARPGFAHLSQRREVHAGVGVTWLTLGEDAAPTRAEDEVAMAFGAFLDRERPDCVHFEHLAKLGTGLIHEATRRGLPAVYCAHDYYPASEHYTLLAPDLTPIDPRDPSAQARCDLALAWLDGRPALGDHHRHVLPEQLTVDEAAQLHELLHGTAPGLREATERCNLRARNRQRAFQALDRRFATSHFLARALEGMTDAEFAVRPAGIDSKELLQLEPRAERSTLRIGFLGGVTKHKGVHLLLDATENLDKGCEVHLFGDSADRAYVRDIRARARAQGAHWHGAYDREDLPRILGEIDVVVVPSLWSENAPFVIREAFAARRPVVVSDTEALAESVRHGVDGLVFAQGDREALHHALAHLAQDPEFFLHLAKNAPAVASIDQEAQAWIDTHEDLLRERRAHEPQRLPAHLFRFDERWRELEALPMRELAARAAAGLRELGPMLGVDDEAAFATALGRGSRSRDARIDDSRKLSWMRSSLEGQDTARHTAQEALSWREEQVTELDERVRWLEDQSRDQSAERDELRRQLAASEAARAALEEECDWHVESTGGLEREREELRAKLDQAGDTLAEAVRERTWLRGLQDNAQAEREALTNAQTAVQAELEREQSDHKALRDHETWLRKTVVELFETPSSKPWGPDEIAESLELGRQQLERAARELDWRRTEMDAVRHASAKLRARLAGNVTRRARHWPETESGEEAQ